MFSGKIDYITSIKTNLLSFTLRRAIYCPSGANVINIALNFDQYLCINFKIVNFKANHQFLLFCKYVYFYNNYNYCHLFIDYICTLNDYFTKLSVYRWTLVFLGIKYAIQSLVIIDNITCVSGTCDCEVKRRKFRSILVTQIKSFYIHRFWHVNVW